MFIFNMLLKHFEQGSFRIQQSIKLKLMKSASNENSSNRPYTSEVISLYSLGPERAAIYSPLRKLMMLKINVN